MGSKTKIHLIRHGQSVANVNAFYGLNNYDAPLTDEGIIQVNQLANDYSEQFKNRKIWILISPMQRARQTAQPLIDKIRFLGKYVDIEISPLCREYIYSKADLLTNEQKQYPENMKDFKLRCQEFKNYIKSNYSNYDDILIFSHALFIQYFINDNGKYPVPRNAIPIILEY